MSDLIDTTEMYLRTIFEVEEEGGVPLRARIAERLGHSGPTVSQTVARMERDGLLTIADGRRIVLTPEGAARATRVMRKHRVAERLLVDVIGLPWHEAHEEACRWEHVMSADVEQRVVALLDEPARSPFGNPIPGLEELQAEPGPDFLDGVVPLADLVGTAPDAVRATLVRLGEYVQTDAGQLRLLHEAGLVPGAALTARAEGDRIVVSGPQGSVELPRECAGHIFVAAA